MTVCMLPFRLDDHSTIQSDTRPWYVVSKDGMICQSVCVRVRACVRACVRSCVRACVRACVRVYVRVRAYV